VIVGLLQVHLVIREALSLKDKRRVIKSLKDRLRSRFNVSVAEVDHLSQRQRATLGLAFVGNEQQHVDAALAQVMNLIRAHRGAELIDYEVEWV